jgi:flagellar assembly protein FliH
VDSTCYFFPELLGVTTGRAAQSAVCEFRRTAMGPAPASRSAASEALRRAGMRPAGIEDLEQQAYCRGFDEGMRSGIEQGEKAGAEAARQRLEHGLNSVHIMLQEIESLRRTAAVELETELVQLTLAVARKIVDREIDLAPETVAGIVRRALDRVEHAARTIIRVHPDDLKLLSEISPPLTSGRPEAGRIALEADEGIARGGCMIETDSGEVNARLERQFQVVAEAFRAEFERARMTGTPEP